MRDDGFEARIRRFELARRAGETTALEQILGESPGPSGPDRVRLLVELLCVDLEYAWRGWPGARPTPLDGYVARFPELIALDSLPIELIAEEYRARRNWGDRPAHAVILGSFRGRHAAILRELHRVDAEIAAEDEQVTGARPSRTAEAPPAAPMVEAEGLLRSDRDFVLRRLIGAGRMGKVYAATRRDGRGPVAVKFLRKSLLAEPGAVRRFIGEARTVARLRHRHIVGTAGLGRTAGGSYFIVMDLIAGPNLAEVIRRGPVAIADAARWVLQAGAGLDHAHRCGIIHCDLKPANLLLDPAGQILVTDFGLARSLTEATPGVASVEGTAPFMAPEQASPAWGPIDHRTDVYGLGAVYFALLTGRPPHQGRRIADVLARVVAAAPVPSSRTFRPEIPPAVAAVCQRALEKAPAARFPDVEAFCVAVRAIT